jgi:Bacterial Ig-like domain (group 3)
MSVLYARRSPARGRVSVAGASFCCVLALALVTGSSSAAALSGRGATHAHASAQSSSSGSACKRARRNGPQKASKQSCQAKKPNRRRSARHGSSITKTGTTHTSTSSTRAVALQEQPPIETPQPGPMPEAMPGAPLEAPVFDEPAPPAETPPVETPPVEKTKTLTTLSSSANPSALGQSVTYTASVLPKAAAGAITFQDAGNPISGCGAQTDVAGTATCTVTGYTTARSHTITATYNGNTNYLTSTSSTLTQTIETPAVETTSTTTTLSSSTNPSTVGQSVTYTASVQPTTATGTVTFNDAGTPITGCTTQTDISGTATCTVTSYTTAGPNTITATYNGSTNYLTSTSATLTQTVETPAVETTSTTTTLSSSTNPSTVGQSVTYTASVHPTSAEGMVTFKDAGTPITGCTTQTSLSGTATCTVTGYTTASPNTITATYNGNPSYLTSTSNTLTQTVEKASTTTTLSSSSNPSTVEQSVTYTASVQPAMATGTIAFQDAGTPITGCTAQTVSSGTATCTVTGYTTAGPNTITATYNGNPSYLTSTSNTLTQTVETQAPFRFFSPTSFWNEPVPANAAVDPNSAAMVSSFAGEIAAAEEAKKGLPTIDTTAWSVPIYTVSGNQATVKVTQAISYGSKVNAALQSSWDAVPLPPEAKPAAGTDRDLVVWQPSTDHLWEFWGLERTEEGWAAKWGGAMDSASTDPGVYGPEAWPGAQVGWGVSATSLSVAGGLITLEDLELGQINHALAIAIPNARAGEYASPANRTDGYSTAPLSLPEGAHLRLDPNLNLASLHLPHMTLMLAEAAQRYGIFVRDSGQNVAFVGQDPTPTGANPYTETHGYYEGKPPQQLLTSFPWKYLEVLKMELHSVS